MGPPRTGKCGLVGLSPDEGQAFCVDWAWGCPNHETREAESGHSDSLMLPRFLCSEAQREGKINKHPKSLDT